MVRDMAEILAKIELNKEELEKVVDKAMDKMRATFESAITQVLTDNINSWNEAFGKKIESVKVHWVDVSNLTFESKHDYVLGDIEVSFLEEKERVNEEI